MATTSIAAGPDTFAPRAYPDIVRDVLTTLTGGTVREQLVVPPGDAALPLTLLSNRPVRRVSHLEGLVAVGTGPSTREIPYVFTSADFELVSSTGDPDALDRIAFRPKGRHPVPGSTLTVNYYPIQTAPVPLTDLNVGSVVRTLLETVSVELALTYQQLQRVYRSGFLATAEGTSLDQVVALIGVARLPANQPVVSLRFTRRDDVAGRLAIPAGTAVTDAGRKTWYLTTVELVLEAGEASREVLAAGESPATKIVDSGALDRMEIAVAGVSQVTNPQPSRAPASPEADDALRRRAAGAFHGIVRGTGDALIFAVRSVPGVKDVKLTEFPNGVPGEIRLDVAYGDPSDAVKAEVARVVDDFRPAGVRVLSNEAPRLAVAVAVQLTLAGPLGGATDLVRLQQGIEQRLADHLSSIPPGGAVRRSRLAALVLADPEVADAIVTLSPAGGTPGPELTLPEGHVIDVTRPFEFAAPAVEGGTSVPTTSTVNAILPVRLVAGVTVADATSSITAAARSYLGGLGPAAALTFDGLAAAIRDDTRFGLVRNEATVTVEGGGRFLQLTDGIGAYTLTSGETLQLGQLDLDPREGGA